MRDIDTSGMIVDPSAATVHDHILPGPIYSGATPLPDAPKLSPSRTINVRLDVVHRPIEIADGVKLDAWTFGGQVPGPTVRVKQGDRIHFVMANRSSESAMVTPPMPHSFDAHAAIFNPQDKMRAIGPGQTIEFDFVANYPGVYMYHCGTPMILEHIIRGMYGAFIVEPKGGYPTKADREYVVVQSEFYAKKVARKGVTGVDMKAALHKTPSYVTFNGRAFRHVKEMLKAKSGETVRLFVLNAGPNLPSAFHVIGTIFERVWLEGIPTNELRGGQVISLGPSNSAIVEFRIPEKGQYPMVTHAWADAYAGAMGAIEATD